MSMRVCASFTLSRALVYVFEDLRQGVNGASQLVRQSKQFEPELEVAPYIYQHYFVSIITSSKRSFMSVRLVKIQVGSSMPWKDADGCIGEEVSLEDGLLNYYVYVPTLNGSQQLHDPEQGVYTMVKFDGATGEWVAGGEHKTCDAADITKELPDYYLGQWTSSITHSEKYTQGDHSEVKMHAEYYKSSTATTTSAFPAYDMITGGGIEHEHWAGCLHMVVQPDTLLTLHDGVTGVILAHSLSHTIPYVECGQGGVSVCEAPASFLGATVEQAFGIVSSSGLREVFTTATLPSTSLTTATGSLRVDLKGGEYHIRSDIVYEGYRKLTVIWLRPVSVSKKSVKDAANSAVVLSVMIFVVGLLFAAVDIVLTGRPLSILTTAVRYLEDYDTTACMDHLNRINRFCLLDIGGLHTALCASVTDLAYYKSYLPKSLFLDEFDSTDETPDTPNSVVTLSTACYVDKVVMRVSILPKGCVATIHAPVIVDSDVSTVVARYSEFISAVEPLISSSNGCLHALSYSDPDTLCASWGIVIKCKTPCLRACRAVGNMQFNRLACGVANAKAHAGNLGNNSIRGFVLMGPALEGAYSCMEVSKDLCRNLLRSYCVITLQVQHTLSNKFKTFPVALVALSSHPSVVYALGERQNFDERSKQQWIMQVEAATSSHEELVTCITGIITGTTTTSDIDALISSYDNPISQLSDLETHVYRRLQQVRKTPKDFVQVYHVRKLSSWSE
eukprot:TRINITY_DN9374_c0_g1_i1.p1 TRINITY_DN9374_c0_g1~~TRINITY_DN9374_c0_g1_i1.p1  ORF type:complete len:731 (+),score=132.37 TRINITY_DN9374_c0_g1_i1:151-2343(+)